jgi:hypothetical protein
VGTIAQSRVVRCLNLLQTCRRIGGENLDELTKLFSAEATDSRIVLNLKELTLVDEDAVILLKRCEADGLTLKNCPAYIREWITSLK